MIVRLLFLGAEPSFEGEGGSHLGGVIMFQKTGATYDKHLEMVGKHINFHLITNSVLFYLSPCA